MSVDAKVKMRVSESRPITAFVAAPNGFTVTINSGSWELLTSDGNTTLNTWTTISGFDSGPLSKAKAWVNFGPTTLDILPGSYLVLIKVNCTGSDGIPRTVEELISVSITPDSV